MALFFVVVKVLSLAAFRVYRMTWRYVGISDLVNIILALFIQRNAGEKTSAED